MHKRTDLFKQEQYKLKVSFVVVLLLMVWGLVFNEMTQSDIVELDASAYVISGIVGLITIYVSQLQKRPKDSKHPLGYSGFIPLLNLMRSFMIILICLKGIGSSLGDLYYSPPPIDHQNLFIYSCVTLLFNFATYLYTANGAKKLNSDLLKTDSLEWRIDTFYNVAILAAVTISFLLKKTSYGNLADYVDPVFCILMSFFMAYYPVKLFYTNAQLLSVSNVDEEMKQTIATTFLKSYPGIKKYDPQFTVLHVAGSLWIDIEFVLNQSESISAHQLTQLQEIAQQMMQQKAIDYRLSFQFTQK